MMPTGAAFMILVCLIVGLAGIVFSSPATLGNSLVGFAILLAILSRMLQASAYERRK